MIMNEVTIFRPNSRRKEATVKSPVEGSIVNALAERLGAEAADKTRKAFNTMKRDDIEFMQFRLDNRKIRVKQIEA